MLHKTVESIIDAVPLFRRLYVRHAAAVKRGYCLLLHRFGLLKPVSFVQWLATYACDCRCPFCEAAAGAPHDDELTTLEVKLLIDNLAGMNVRRLLVSGGEPLERPDIIELLEYANHSGLQLGLVTNGYRVPELWDALKRFHYFLYFTSLDGNADYHDTSRNRTDAFLRTLQSVALFTGLPVKNRIINTVVQKNNLDLLDELYTTVNRSGANYWRLTPVANTGRAAGRSGVKLNKEELEYCLSFIKKKIRAVEYRSW